MNTAVALRAKNVSKEYRLGIADHRMMTQDIIRWWHNRFGRRQTPDLENESKKTPAQPKNFLALDDVSFEIEPGDALGIIGSNGAGKSTLLKLIARVTLPSRGTILVNGRILSMLEVGTGFVPDLSGRENVFLNGMLLGMSKEEVHKKFDEIVEFAEVSQFIDTQVKRYSSGMQVRLAFSVAAHFDAEIMIIDEVLSVGDARFQKKCMEKMHGILHQGRTILFVSHNMEAVGKICNKGMLLDQGRSVYFGPASEALKLYEKANNADAFTPGATFDPVQIGKPAGDDYCRLLSAGVFKADGSIAETIDIEEALLIRLVFEIDHHRDSIFVPNIALFRFDGNCAFVAVPPFARPLGAGRYAAECAVPGHFLNDGVYFVGLEMTSHIGKRSTSHFTQLNLLTFRVDDSRDDPERFRYSQKSVISGGARPTAFLNWKIESASN